MQFTLYSIATAMAFFAAADAAPHGERHGTNGGPSGLAQPTGTFDGEGRGGPGNVGAFPTEFPTNGELPSEGFGQGRESGAGLTTPIDTPISNHQFGDGLSALASQIEEWFGGGKRSGSSQGSGPAFPTGGLGFPTGLFPSDGSAFPTGGFGFPGGDKPPSGEKPSFLPPSGGASPTGGFGFSGGDELPSGDGPSGIVPPESDASPTTSAVITNPAPTEPATLPSDGLGDLSTVSFVLASTTAGGFGFGARR